MTWIFLAIASHFFWAIGNIGDKFVLENKVKNPYVYQVWIAIVGLLVFAMVPFIDFVIPEASSLFLLAVAGALLFFGSLPYVKAMQLEDVTRINIWWSMIPIFSFAIGWVALNEKILGVQLLAFFILILSTILASIHFKGVRLKFSKALFLMVLTCLSFSIHAVILKYVMGSVDFWSAFVWIRLFAFLAATLMFLHAGFRKGFVAETKAMDKSLAGFVFAITINNDFGFFLSTWALSLGPVAMVYAMEGAQPIFVFLIVLLLSAFTKVNLREELDRKNLALKFLALVLMVAGVIMINI